jgi:hypothetical protein
MRAAALTSAAVIAIGTYLMIASFLAFTPTWIALGTLAIAVAVAVTLVGTEGRAVPSR